MINELKIFVKYAKYKLTTRYYKRCGIDTPFVNYFIEKAIFGSDVTGFDDIEKQRQKLLTSKTVLTVCDYGEGSCKKMGVERSVSDLTRFTAVKPKYGKLLSRVVNHLRPGVIIELGTGLGFSTMYMAAGDHNCKIFTIEGSRDIAGIALQNFQETGIKRVHLLRGTFGEKFPVVIKNINDYPLLFIDGDHRKDNVILYVEQWLSNWQGGSVMVLDDIHWSDEMEEAWKYIVSKPEVNLSFDLFQMGILFVKKGFVKQHYIIRF